MWNENSLDGAVARGAKSVGLGCPCSAHSRRENGKNEVCTKAFDGILGWITCKRLDFDRKCREDAADSVRAVAEGEHGAVMHVDPEPSSMSCSDEENYQVVGLDSADDVSG